jgi:dolichol-phosphate mannosyltransferase
MKKILVATATFNEALNIKKLINKIINLNIKLDILVIDDNSPDKTWLILQELKDKYKNLHLIIRPGKGGLDSAHKKIYEFAIKNKYQYLITMDADLSHDPSVIPIFLKHIKKYDCVFGSRYIKGGKNDLQGFRLYLSRYGNNLIQFLLKINLSEFTTSYRCFNLPKLKKFHFNQVKVGGYSFFMFVVFLLNGYKYSIKEIPIRFFERINGKSKIPKIEIFRTLKNVILLYFKN